MRGWRAGAQALGRGAGSAAQRGWAREEAFEAIAVASGLRSERCLGTSHPAAAEGLRGAHSPGGQGPALRPLPARLPAPQCQGDGKCLSAEGLWGAHGHPRHEACAPLEAAGAPSPHLHGRIAGS